MTHQSSDIGMLAGLTVNTLANAVETFGVVAPNRGYTSQPLMCHYPALGPMAGFAVTVQATTNRAPNHAPSAIDEHAYWRWVAAQPRPKIVVVQDLDDPPAGAMWGEWNANVHRALGCVGTVTQGAVRDIDAVEKVGFHFFSTHVSVSHGCGKFVGYGLPVEVAGLAIATGDLLVADVHGALSIPAEIPLTDLAHAARSIDALEAEVFAYCQSDAFTVDGLASLDASVAARWPRGLPTTR